ncbi:hypothetical protein [Chryseobacterium tongliaoense]|uniref:hypothetical protein n=1 Tax=Chryseobacterium tongliaoense TaxID=3240933 RepID=UPI0035175FD1
MKEILVDINTADIHIVNKYDIARCYEVNRSEWSKKDIFFLNKIYAIEFKDCLIFFRRIISIDKKFLKTQTDKGIQIYELENISRIMLVICLEKDMDNAPTLEMRTMASLSCTDEAIEQLKFYDDDYAKCLIKVFTDFQKHKSFEKMKSDYDEIDNSFKYNLYGFNVNASIQEVIYPAI